MRSRDTSFDILSSLAAIAADALAVWGGFLLATLIRFYSGWIPLKNDTIPEHLFYRYGMGGAVATLLFLFLFRNLSLYIRPQTGSFADKIPRLIRATAIGILFTTALAFAIRTDPDPPFSRATVGVAFLTIGLLVIVERWLLFRIEMALARRHQRRIRVLIVGTDSVALHLQRSLEQDPRLGAQFVGFIETGAGADAALPAEPRVGTLADLPALLERQAVDQVILTDTALPHEQTVGIVLACERTLTRFNVVPDMFRLMTGNVAVQTVDGIPLLGVSRLPLDRYWNRCAKRAEDIAGALVGLVLTAPIMLAAAALIRRESPGPVLYRQKRCGERGREFTLYKLRTMHVDAEVQSGPVWAAENDPRRTHVGAWLRAHNLDELPQLWNVLRGDMSLVGPRPERPFFVEQFREDIQRYMARHVSKPGLTGWAQINGLRGNTSIDERIKFDLYYLENWSLAFDFKILLKTLFARRNAY